SDARRTGGRMRMPMLVMVFVLAANANAWAQEPVRFEVFGGYSYTSADFRTSGFAIGAGVTSDGLPAGGDASFTYSPLDEIGLTAEFGRHYGSEDKGPTIGPVDQTLQTYMFGPRLMERGQRVEGFINILGGLWKGVVDTRDGQLSDAKIAVSI